MSIIGYKVFDQDWTCRGFKYEVGHAYSFDEEPIICKRGFHFCEKLVDCFNYYSFNPNNKIAVVEALGEVSYSENHDKACTNSIKILREITWYEVLDLVNIGRYCTGLCNIGDFNSGDRNSGNWNSGDWNSGNSNIGDCNTGNWNSGDFNSGDFNSGDFNSGRYNSGDYNSGRYNSGDYNSGDWNVCNYSNGCFNTCTPKIYIFDKPSNITYRDWFESDAAKLLNRIPSERIDWIPFDDMSDTEKKENPNCKTTGGYLKTINATVSDRQKWFDNLSDNQKDIIKSIPNFDPKIFKVITGIDVEQ